MTVSFTLRLVLISLFLTYLERSETLWSQSKLLTSTTKLRNRFSHSLVCLLWRISSSPLTSGCRYGSVNSSCAQPPPPQATLGHLPTLSVLGVGHLQILCTVQGPGIGQPQGQPQTFDTHGFLSEYNYTEDFTGKTSRLAHLSRTEKNWTGLEMYVPNFMHAFLHCLSSQNYIAKSGSIDKNQLFFGYWIKFVSILFEEHPFVFIKLFQTVNFTGHY